MLNSFTENVIEIIKLIPNGKVATYGQIAAIAGNPRASRQVVRVLHTMSRKYNLSWHRIINSHGKIVIKDPDSADEQRARLIAEGISVNDDYTVNLENFRWEGL